MPTLFLMLSLSLLRSNTGSLPITCVLLAWLSARWLEIWICILSEMCLTGSMTAVRQAMEDNADRLDEGALTNAFAFMRKCQEDGIDDVFLLLQQIVQKIAAMALIKATPATTPLEGSINRVWHRLANSCLQDHRQLMPPTGPLPVPRTLLSDARPWLGQCYVPLVLVGSTHSRLLQDGFCPSHIPHS